MLVKLNVCDIPSTLKLNGYFYFMSQMLSKCHFILMKQLTESSFLRVSHALDYGGENPSF